MPAIKPTARVAEKWSRVTPQRTEDYRDGVESPRVDWATAAANAEDQYSAGVQAAIAQKRFGSGIKAAGTTKWKEKSLQKGPSRFAEGVSLGAADYEKGFSKFRDVIERTTLPPRGPKGDPRNVERVRAMAAALRAAKTGTPTR